MDIADIFIQELLLEEFDKKPLERQALEVQHMDLEVRNMKEKYDLFNARYQRNCGSLGGHPKKHSDETIQWLIEEIKIIQASDEYKRRKRKNEKNSTAYIMLIEKVLVAPDTEKLFIESGWLSSFPAHRNDEIKRLAKNFQQIEHRYNKKCKLEHNPPT